MITLYNLSRNLCDLLLLFKCTLWIMHCAVSCFFVKLYKGWSFTIWMRLNFNRKWKMQATHFATNTDYFLQKHTRLKLRYYPVVRWFSIIQEARMTVFASPHYNLFLPLLFHLFSCSLSPSSIFRVFFLLVLSLQCALCLLTPRFSKS